MKPVIETIPGELPPFWNRNVLFFCNMHSIFFENEEGTNELINQIYGAHTYGGRVISVLNLLFQGGPNKILLEAPPEPNLLDYLSGDLHLSLPTFDLLDHNGYRNLASKLRKEGSESDPFLEELKNHPAPWVDGFVTDAVLARIATKLGKQTVSTLKGSKNGNNKYLLYRYQVEQKLPVFETLIASNREEIASCLGQLRESGYRKAVIKAQIGASGYGMVKLKTEEAQLESLPDYLFFEGPCMVQGWLDSELPGVTSIGSPSVQMFLNDKTVFLFDWTEQILSDDSVHEGNMSPPPYIRDYDGLKEEIFRQSVFAGEWLHVQGYRGAASTDFLVVQRESRIDVIICEINARLTGATYPALLARHFKPEGCWNARNIQFRKPLDGAQLLSLIDETAMLYRPGNDRGILPYNFNLDADGKVIKGQFLCLGNSGEECAGFLAQAWTKLPVEWGYVRD